MKKLSIFLFMVAITTYLFNIANAIQSGNIHDICSWICCLILCIIIMIISISKKK